MAVEQCPLPQVAEALAPYIKQRDEVAKVRRGLQIHLQEQINRDGDTLSNVNITSPNASKIGLAPSSITGVRRAYWKALDAQIAAQAKCDALRIELDQLKRPATTDNGPHERHASRTDSDEYVALLRQREKHRKLQVINKALSNITARGDSSSAGTLEDLIKSKVGELPIPPSTQPSFSRRPDVDAKITQLKKAVVSTKRRMEEHKRAAAGAIPHSTDAITTEAEVAGLQKALQELTTWMEAQLTVIAEAEIEPRPPVDSQFQDGQGSSGVNLDNIEELYESYLDARQLLVQDINDSESSASRIDVEGTEWMSENSTQGDPTSLGPATKSSATTLLPFLPALASVKSEEQSLIQQTAYIRRQLSSAEGDTARLIQRLAHESHIVQTDASQGKDWADAGRAAGQATTESVVSRLNSGHVSADAAKAVYDSFESVTAGLEALSPTP